MSDELDEPESLTASLNARPRREKLLATARGAARLDPAPRRQSTLALIRLAITPDIAVGPGGPVVSDAIPDIVPEILSAAWGDAIGVEYWNNGLDYSEPEEWANMMAIHSAAEMMLIDPGNLRASHRQQLERWRGILAKFRGKSLRARVEAIRRHREVRAFLPESLSAALWPAKPENADVAPADNIADHVANVPMAEVLDFLKGVASKEKTKPILKAEVHDRFKPKPVTDEVFEEAYQGLPSQLKRVRGETNKKRASDSRAAGAAQSG
jgi:hypothetical protein